MNAIRFTDEYKDDHQEHYGFNRRLTNHRAGSHEVIKDRTAPWARRDSTGLQLELQRESILLTVDAGRRVRQGHTHW